jgi:hypothetical protein
MPRRPLGLGLRLGHSTADAGREVATIGNTAFWKDRTQRLEAEINDLKQQLAQAQHEIEVLRAQLDEAIAPTALA